MLACSNGVAAGVVAVSGRWWCCCWSSPPPPPYERKAWAFCWTIGGVIAPRVDVIEGFVMDAKDGAPLMLPLLLKPLLPPHPLVVLVLLLVAIVEIGAMLLLLWLADEGPAPTPSAVELLALPVAYGSCCLTVAAVVVCVDI